MDFSNSPLKYRSLIFHISLVLICFVVTAGYAAQRKEIVKIKQILSARLDSLEMEKQIRKRQGEPLAELESESRSIHDSIAVLRKQLAGTYDGETPSQEGDAGVSPVQTVLRLFRKPAHIFDWIIIIVGLIAVLSGIILIGGVVHTVFSRKKKPPRKKVQQSEKQTQMSGPAMGPGGGPLSGSPSATENGEGDITVLRKRMKRDIERIQRFNENSSPFSNSQEPGPAREEQDTKDTLREDIIRTAQEGLNAQEISRKFHVSVDQVALILRVASKDQSGIR